MVRQTHANTCLNVLPVMLDTEKTHRVAAYIHACEISETIKAYTSIIIYIAILLAGIHVCDDKKLMPQITKSQKLQCYAGIYTSYMFICSFQ